MNHLAEGFGALGHAPVLDLDLIHWKENASGTKQDKDVARPRRRGGSSRACTGGLLKGSSKPNRMAAFGQVLLQKPAALADP
jgi:hypothetical protein